jgi:hypothetical protein
MTPTTTVPSDLIVEEGGFACFCTASCLEDGGWTSAVRFELRDPAGMKPRSASVSHRVPGVFLDSESALSAAAAYAARTVQWRRV